MTVDVKYNVLVTWKMASKNLTITLNLVKKLTPGLNGKNFVLIYFTFIPMTVSGQTQYTTTAVANRRIVPMILDVVKAINAGALGIPRSGIFRGEPCAFLDRFPNDKDVKIQLTMDGPHKGHTIYVPADCLIGETDEEKQILSSIAS